MIREVQLQDLPQLLGLYSFLHSNAIPPLDNGIEGIWRTILNDPHHHIIVGVDGDTIISSCVLVIIPNLTHNQRPYALIENVITHPEHREKGHATALLNYAKQLAVDSNCYKIMLMTGSKKESTLAFYQRSGYNSNDKTAFIQWLE
ncbi:GNAT family N-acetyltransferase [Ruminococcaceae bacterium OttesenSCG-928-L11]|nr:GNAT family N-acetyltransferase [Ruminococcaceae bacterium OttesenSCG-928-L11]